jgi:hypothetical protein
MAGVRITPKAYYDVERKETTLEMNAVSAIPLSSLGTELDVTATAGEYQQRDAVKGAAPEVKAWGDYWLLGVAVPAQVTKHLKLTAGWAYSEGGDAYLKQGVQPKLANAAAVGRGIATVSAGWTF